MNEGREVRPLTVDDADAWTAMIGNAYPVMDLHTRETREAQAERIRQRIDAPSVRWYGLFQGGTLLGGMRLHDFQMTCFETPLLVGGVGMVAVDLAHKKEHVARDLIAFYLRHYRERGAPLAILYPFRPDFYHAMGFGYGPKMNSYRIAPEALPARGDRARVRFLGEEDRASVVSLYNEIAARAHGMITIAPDAAPFYLARPEWRLVGWHDQSGALRGYLAFDFELPDRHHNFVLQDIVVHELIYADSEALLGLLAFLRSQRDQARAIIFHTLSDDFHYLLADPRNGTQRLTPHVYHESNTQGVGLMYRLLDVRRFFMTLPNHRFGSDSLTLRLTLRDSFLPEQDGSLVVRFDHGAAHLEPDDAPANVELQLKVTEASPLLMGVVSLRSLYDFGLAEVSDASAVSRLDALFRTERPPVCLTPF
jgi:predicted acetyltransferase